MYAGDVRKGDNAEKWEELKEFFYNINTQEWFGKTRHGWSKYYVSLQTIPSFYMSLAPLLLFILIKCNYFYIFCM